MIFASIFLSCLGIATNIWLLALCIILGHMGVAFFHPQATSIISNYSKLTENSKDMSIFIAMGTFGFALGPAISSSIAQHWGLEKLPFACFIGILFAFYVLKKTANGVFSFAVFALILGLVILEILCYNVCIRFSKTESHNVRFL